MPLCRWYSQAGTPRLTVTPTYNAADKTYTLRFKQVRINRMLATCFLQKQNCCHDIACLLMPPSTYTPACLALCATRFPMHSTC